MVTTIINIYHKTITNHNHTWVTTADRFASSWKEMAEMDDARRSCRMDGPPCMVVIGSGDELVMVGWCGSWWWWWAPSPSHLSHLNLAGPPMGGLYSAGTKDELSTA